jgi:hypothetical protein
VKKVLFLLVFLVIVTSISEGADSRKGFHKAKTNGTFIHYEGSAIVSGAYHVELRDEGDSTELGFVCFSVHGPTERFIPRENDWRNAWFCFANTAKARAALKIPSKVPPGTCIIYGKATVQISKYIVNRCESECHDSAVLDKVISYEKPTFRKECNAMP